MRYLPIGSSRLIKRTREKRGGAKLVTARAPLTMTLCIRS